MCYGPLTEEQDAVGDSRRSVVCVEEDDSEEDAIQLAVVAEAEGAESGSVENVAVAEELSNTMMAEDINVTLDNDDNANIIISVAFDEAEGGENEDVVFMVDTDEGGGMVGTADGGDMVSTAEGGDMVEAAEGGDMVETAEGADISAADMIIEEGDPDCGTGPTGETEETEN